MGPSPLILKGARRNFLAECFPRKIVALPTPTREIPSTVSLSPASQSPGDKEAGWDRAKDLAPVPKAASKSLFVVTPLKAYPTEEIQLLSTSLQRGQKWVPNMFVLC